MTHSRRAGSALLAASLLLALAASLPVAAAELDGPVSVVLDANNVPTVVATTEHDAIYMQGFLHAKDRFWQMDFLRHVFKGTVSELVGSAGIPQDVQLRTLGLRRAAERGLAAQTPEVNAWIEAYADGVNAYILDVSQPIPLQYGALELTRDSIAPWTPLDTLTMVKGLAFQLSFGLDDIDNTLALLNFLGVGDALGFNGLQLFNNDLYRKAPFDPTISIPSALNDPSSAITEFLVSAVCNVEDEATIDFALESDAEVYAPIEALDDMMTMPDYIYDPSFKASVQTYHDELSSIPFLVQFLETDYQERGSNWWIADGSLTDSGFPMIANDPHLSLGAPSTFYESHLNVAGAMNVTGISFAGAPGIVQGCNDTICWGSTVNPLDVTDVYQEVLIASDPANPTQPTHTFFRGALEPLQFIPQQFFVNVIGDGTFNNLVDAMVPADQGGVTLIVPRRNNGPIVQISFDPASPTPLTGISVAYTGWSATQELECFRRFARAASPQDFKDALQFFDVGSQNWGYADINGNIAYYTSAELPIREDLQLLFFPEGLIDPGLIRDGSGTSMHEWLPLANPQPNQALGTEILPFAEMPQVENPASGYILNANNDPIGTSLDNVSWNQFRAGFNGALYLSPGYAPGYRIGRINQMFLDAVSGGPLTEADYRAIQSNNQLLDAEVLTPYILDAYANATAGGAAPELAPYAADAQLAEAIGRLAAWDFSTPTGIDAGFDPGDNPLAPGPPSQAEIDASVAATIYSMWRGQIVQRVVDTTLASLPVPLDSFAPGSSEAMKAVRRLLDTYSVNGGTGASLINFFTVPGVADQFVARDIILLQALRDGLDLAASDDFAPAFANSTNLEDYRWGQLHRIVFASNLGGPFNIPPPGSPQNLAPDLPGFSRSGGMGAVDASSHSARADGLNEFMFGSGPARRFIATMTPSGPDAQQVIPGGESGNPGDPFQADQLGLWLTNNFHALPVSLEDVEALGVATLTFECGDDVVGPGEECDDGNTDPTDGCNSSCNLEPIPSEVPTVSEWGLILMSMLLLTVATLVFGTRRRTATVGGTNRSFGSGFTAPPFDGPFYTRVLLATLGLVLVGFVAALAVSGSVTGVDLAGSLLCAPVFAYWVHLWAPRGRN